MLVSPNWRAVGFVYTPAPHPKNKREIKKVNRDDEMLAMQENAQELRECANEKSNECGLREAKPLFDSRPCA
jgi:hypothetical protein